MQINYSDILRWHRWAARIMGPSWTSISSCLYLIKIQTETLPWPISSVLAISERLWPFFAQAAPCNRQITISGHDHAAGGIVDNVGIVGKEAPASPRKAARGFFLPSNIRRKGAISFAMPVSPIRFDCPTATRDTAYSYQSRPQNH